jgi:hypothetical protein
MKKTYVLLFFILFVYLKGYSQTISNSFKITNNAHPESEAFFIKSIEKANMESYRLKSRDVSVEFENGFTCVFESAKSLYAKGIQVNPANYLEEFPKEYTLPKFKIIDAGNIYAIYTPIGKYK